MKTLGLLVVLFGGAMLYLIGFKCYRWPDFVQELKNFSHVGAYKAVSPPDCNPVNPFAKKS